MQRRAFHALLAGTLILQSCFAIPVRAQEATTTPPGFDPNRVLEDSDIFDVTAMSYSEMVGFLRSKGTLADYRTPDIDGVPKTVPEIIWRVANSYKISPKYLLALMQKEQSLVEDPKPTQKQFDWATGYGVCDTCSKDDPAIQNFKGFASQVEWAAKQFREKYLLQLLGGGTTRAGKATGKPMIVDGVSVTPVNNATAMLYSYTPHLHGNINLWTIWRRWFSLKFPDGTIVRATTSGKTYEIRFGQKRQFASRAVAETSVDPDKVIDVSDTELSAYPDGPDIRFPKYSLLRDPKGHIWLLTDAGRSQIVDMATFHKFGFNEDEIEDVADADLASYTVGPKITQKTEFPQGVVEQDQKAKTYWYIEDNVRHLIPDKAFLSLYFQGRNIKAVAPVKLVKYEIGNPYRLHDGELVRGVKKTDVFVIENDTRRPIPSAFVFESLGWKWKNVVTIPDSVLATYTVGQPFTLESVVPDTDTSTSTVASL